MLKAEEENIEETSSDDSGDEAAENEDELKKKTSSTISKSISTKVASNKLEAVPPSKSALNKTAKTSMAVGLSNQTKKEVTKLPALVNKGSSMQSDADVNRPVETSFKQRQKNSQPMKFNSSMDLVNPNSSAVSTA